MSNKRNALTGTRFSPMKWRVPTCHARYNFKRMFKRPFAIRRIEADKTSGASA